MTQDLSKYIEEMKSVTSLEEGIKILNQVGVLLKLWKGEHFQETDKFWYQIAPTDPGSPGDNFHERNEIFRNFANNQDGFEFLIKYWKTSFCGCILDHNVFVPLYLIDSSEEFLENIYEAYRVYSYYSVESQKMLEEIGVERLVKVLPRWWKTLACGVDSKHREMPLTLDHDALKEWFDYEFSTNSEFDPVLEYMHIFLLGTDAVYGASVRSPWSYNCYHFLKSIHKIIWGESFRKLTSTKIVDRIKRYTLLTSLVASELGANPPDHPFRTILEDA